MFTKSISAVLFISLILPIGCTTGTSEKIMESPLTYIGEEIILETYLLWPNSYHNYGATAYPEKALIAGFSLAPTLTPAAQTPLITLYQNGEPVVCASEVAKRYSCSKEGNSLFCAPHVQEVCDYEPGKHYRMKGKLMEDNVLPGNHFQFHLIEIL